MTPPLGIGMLDRVAAGIEDDRPDCPLLFGRVLDGRGGARLIGWAQAQRWSPAHDAEMLWLHLDRTVPGVARWLQDALNIPEPTAELLTSEDTRPRAFREGDALVATLRGININPGADPEDMVSMQLWSDGRRLLTLRHLPLQVPREVLSLLDGTGQGPSDVGALITALTEHMIQRMSRQVIDLNDQIDDLAETVARCEDTGEVLTRVSNIRRECLAMKRHMGPQHVALEAIGHDAPEWFEEHDRRQIAETIALLRRFLDDIDVSKESAVVLMDEIRARSLARSEHTNAILSGVATIFLPLTFLTGLLGINVAGIPEADDPREFWVVVGLCVAIFVLLLLLFRKRRWL